MHSSSSFWSIGIKNNYGKIAVNPLTRNSVRKKRMLNWCKGWPYLVSRYNIFFFEKNEDIGNLAKSISKQYLTMWFLKMLSNSRLLSLPVTIAVSQGTPEPTDYHGLLQPASAKRFKTTASTSWLVSGVWFSGDTGIWMVRTPGSL